MSDLKASSITAASAACDPRASDHPGEEVDRRANPIIAEWPKNQRETFRVSLDVFQGKHVIALRVWFRGNDGLDRPSPRGLTVAVKHLPMLASTLGRALVEARARGLVVDTDDEVGR